MSLQLALGKNPRTCAKVLVSQWLRERGALGAARSETERRRQPSQRVLARPGTCPSPQPPAAGTGGRSETDGRQTPAHGPRQCPTNSQSKTDNVVQAWSATSCEGGCVPIRKKPQLIPMPIAASSGGYA